MATTDDLGGLDSDRLQESLDSGRDAGRAPTGRTIQIDPKIVGCGCFGCSSALVLAAALILLLVVGTSLIPNWNANFRYVPGTCRVIETKVGALMFDRGPKGGKKESYRPEIKIQYEVKGRKIETWAYDATGVYSDDKAAQQAIVDSFRVGASYPFWYDPARPDKAVLVRGGGGSGLLFLIVPVVLLVMGCFGIRLAWKIASAPSFVPSGSPGAPPAARPSPPKFVQALMSAAEARDATFDPTGLDDPVAQKTDWTPLRGDRSSFDTHKLVEADPDRREFRATATAQIFALAFLSLGTLAFLAVAASLFQSRISFHSLIPLPITLGFAAVGGYLLYTGRTPIVLDKRSGYFWKGRKAPDETFNDNPGSNFVPLKEIHAVQLLKSVGTSQRGRYTIYECNLVLGNSDRITTSTYVNPRKARADATAVAEFLGKPFWDAT